MESTTNNSFTTVKQMHYWCYKILPLVYDDSLSYYEVLCKATKKLNEVIANNNNMPQLIAEAIADGGYLDNLQEQIAELNDKDSTTATADRQAGELIWLKGNLYRITRSMLAGDQYIESAEGITGNVEKLSFEDWCNRYREYLKNAFTDNDEGYNALASKSYMAGEWVWWKGQMYKASKEIAKNDTLSTEINLETVTVEDAITAEANDRTQADRQLQNNIDAEATARKEADTQLQNNIDAEATARKALIDTDTDGNTVVTATKDLNVNVTGNREVMIGGDNNEDITGNSEENYAGTHTVYEHGTSNVHAFGDKTVKVDGTMQLDTGTIKYGTPVKISDAFSAIPMIDSTGNNYNLLVQGDLNKVGGGIYQNAIALGMDNSGNTDISTLLYAQASGNNVGFPKGTYKISISGTVNCQCVFAEGAVLSLDEGVTVTFSNISGIEAGRYQIFTGGTINGLDYNGIAYPEWVGSLDIAVNDFNLIVLGCKNYTTTGFSISRGGVTITGEKPAKASTSNTASITATGTITLGNKTTGVINNYPRNIHINNVIISSSASPVVECNCVLESGMKDCYIVANSTGGISLPVAVSFVLDGIYVQSLSDASGAYCYLQNDISSQHTAGYRSASVWYNNCTAAFTTSPIGSNTYAFWVNGPGMSDTFFNNCEVAGAANGFTFSDVNENYDVDMILTGCDADSCTVHCYTIIGTTGCISIAGCYGALTADAGHTGNIAVTGGSTLSIDGYQCITTNTDQISLQAYNNGKCIAHGVVIQGPANGNAPEITETTAGQTVSVDYLLNGVIGKYPPEG